MYCIDCAESLCQACVNYHKKFKSTKTHKLVDCIEESKGISLDPRLLSSYLFCPNHTDKAVEIKCDDHDTLCCLRCATVQHRTCQNVSEIDKIAKEYKRGDEGEKLRSRLEGIKTRIEEIITVNNDCRRDFEKSKEEIPKRLEEIKTKYLALFERIESFVMKGVNTLHSEEDIAIGNREETWKLKLNDHVTLLEMLDSLLELGTDWQVYAAVHKIKETLSGTEEALAGLGPCIISQRPNLNLKEKLMEILETDTIETLVDTESFQNEYHLPKTAANCKNSLEYDTKLSSDTLPDNDGYPNESHDNSRSSINANQGKDPPSERCFSSKNLCTDFKHSKDITYKKEYTTDGGMKVYVYAANILRLPVDCIVNSANENLAHGSGLAKIIEAAAGRRMTADCNAYVRRHGPVPVGGAYTSTAGDLPYACVIHAIGPRWSDYSPYDFQSIKECESLLQDAIISSFVEAEKRHLKTIALTAIRAGVYGVPEEICAVQYANAILKYKDMHVRNKLKEIHFVDLNRRVVRLIQNTFKTMIQG